MAQREKKKDVPINTVGHSNAHEKNARDGAWDHEVSRTPFCIWSVGGDVGLVEGARVGDRSQKP